MTSSLAVLANATFPPPPPPPPPPDGLPPLLMAAIGLGATSAVCLLYYLWRRTPASNAPAGR